ncbi:LLM class flavin-dependent oxidoreductase [Streptomyces sp. AJS327]|nr:LLM class flavin-dependent oxidoreductase [Streptomyces sp. AJS327]
MYPVQPSSVGQVLPFARLLQQRGSGRLWTGQTLRIDPHQLFAALSGMGIRIPMGTAVSLAPLRHPFDAALQARSVATLTGAPYVAGFGPGAREFQESIMAEAYARPGTAMREYLTVMRSLLEGETLEFRGEYHAVDGGLQPARTPPVEVGAGVLRPRMARIAGATADVAITWMTPVDYIANTLRPALAEGAAEAGRKAPRVVTVVHVAVDRPGRDIYQMALTGAGTHLSFDHYTDMLRRGGVEAYADDPQAGARALVDSGTFVAGSPDEIARELNRYREAGVDEVVLNPASIMLSTQSLGTAMRDVQEIFEAVDRNDG